MHPNPTVNVKVSCGCYPRDHCFRGLMVWLIEHIWFDRISMLMIVSNCITLGMYDTGDANCQTSKCETLAIFDLIFGIFFLFEMLAKMIGMGIYGENSYLSQGWNRLDFVIVMASLPDFIPGLEIAGLSLMRILRILRPLRAINRLPSLRILVKLIFATIPMLGNVVLLVMFIIIVFSILGVQLFMGQLGNRCYDDATGSYYVDPSGDPYICSLEENTGMQTCPPSEYPLNYTTCKFSGENPSYGVISYDDIGHAFVATFLVITCEGWTDLVYMVQDAYSFWVWIYFYALVIFGALLAMNLFLVVVASQFSTTKNIEKLAMQKENEALALLPQKLSYSQKFQAFLMEVLFGKKNKRVIAEDEEAFKEKQSKFMALKNKEDGKLQKEALKQAEAQRQKEQEEMNARELQRKQELQAVGLGSPQIGPADSQLALPAPGVGSGSGSGVGAATGAVSPLPLEPTTAGAGVMVEKQELDKKDGEQKQTKDGEEGEERVEGDEEEGEAKYDEEGNRIVRKPKGFSTDVIRWHVREFVNCAPFNNFIMACICFNTLFMASEHYEQPDWLTTAQNFADWTFNIVYIVEMCLKLYGLGVEDYVTNPLNLFDGVLVINSIIEMTIGGGGGLAVLRTFRLMRIFKLFRFLPGLQTQVAVLIASLGEVANFCIILSLFIFIYAVLGMYLFGAKFRFDDGSSRCHFDGLYRAMVTVFQLLTIEDLPGVMYDGVRATSFISTLYFITCIVFGNYILCNLFIAILLDSFAERAREKELEEMEQKQRDLAGKGPNAASKLKNFRKNLTADRRSQFFEHWVEQMLKGRKERLRRQAAELAGLPYEPPEGSRPTSPEEEAEAAAAKEEEDKKKKEAEDDKKKKKKKEKKDGEESDEEDWSDTDDEDDPNVRYRDVERSCCIFGPKDPIRIFCTWVVNHSNFDRFILFMILCNSLAMAFERPKMSDQEADTLQVLGYIFNSIFLFEAITKVIAWGLIWGKNAYLADSWNCLDGFLVVVSIVDFILTLSGVGGGVLLRILKIMRLLRALRPLRVINKAPRLKRVVICMIDSCTSIGNTLIICALVFLIFGILAIQLFGGKMYTCAEGSYNASSVPTTKITCSSAGGSWENSTFNYDNLGEALLTLFYVVSFDGWVDLMYEGVDAKAKYEAPEEDYNEGACIFFILFLIIGNFFVLNLFVGVIVDSFNNSAAGIMAMDNSKSDQELREEKKEEEELQKRLEVETLFYLEYQEGSVQREMYNLVISPEFDMAIGAVIVSNVIAMGVEHWQQSSDITSTLDGLNWVFTIIFVFEALFKIIAFGFSRYLFSDVEVVSSGWNKFDFFLVLASFLGIYFDNAGNEVGIDPTMLRVLRVFRIARILKLLKNAKGLNALLNTVAMSIGQVGSIGMLLMLAFFIYACAAVQVFGKLSCTDDNPCDGMSEHANFESWPNAMLTLFRICTGDAGAAILKDCLRSAPACNDSTECDYNCCAAAPRFVIPIYFITFTVLAQMIMLNVIVAVLMGQLAEEQDAQDAEMAREFEAKKLQEQREEEKKRMMAVVAAESVQASPVLQHSPMTGAMSPVGSPLPPHGALIGGNGGLVPPGSHSQPLNMELGGAVQHGHLPPMQPMNRLPPVPPLGQ